MEIGPFALVQPPAGSEAIADEIQRRLSHVSDQRRVLSGNSKVRAQTNGAQTDAETASPTEPTEMGTPRRYQPDYAVEGSIEFQPGGFHLILQLVQSPTARTSGRKQPIAGWTTWPPWNSWLSFCCANLLAFPNEALARRQASQQDGRDAYLQGRYYWKLATPDTIRNSVACFTRAVETDGNYAAAWAALAEALTVSSMFGFLAPNETGGRMKEAALKAISLNTILPETHIALGSVLSILDWDWEGGERELQKSIQLDNHDPIGHIAYGVQLACRGMCDPAVVEVERALEMDPASLFPNFILGWLYRRVPPLRPGYIAASSGL